jgi:ectoine hydroxylase-related dioxygenase (phytanoyl-CoA dioxygenase family)
MPPALLEACVDSPMAAMAQAIVGEPLEFLSAKPVFKSSQVAFPSPWHQDTAYWRGCRKLSAWLALEPATIDNGCLRVIPGTQHEFIVHEQVTTAEGFGNRLPERLLPMHRSVDAIMATGDVVYFQDHTVHASHPNRSGQERWSLIPTWRPVGGEDTLDFWKVPVPVRARPDSLT